MCTDLEHLGDRRTVSEGVSAFMSGTASLSRKLAFLQAHGASRLAHSRDALYAHLCGTRELLRAWGARPALCDAGLFHSVYGTESYWSSLLATELRTQVREMIGVEAEEIVFLFGVMTKPSFYANLHRREGFKLQHRLSRERIDIDRRRLCDLCNVMAANWLEQRPRVSAERQGVRREEFRTMLPLLLPAARTAISLAYGFTVE